MKLLFTALVIVALLLSTTFLQFSMAGSDFCDKKCAVRCSRTYRKTRCLQFCGICCSKCNCVPSGTVGNKSECACYANMRNTKGTSKCP